MASPKQMSDYEAGDSEPDIVIVEPKRKPVAKARHVWTKERISWLLSAAVLSQLWGQGLQRRQARGHVVESGTLWRLLGKT
jgi:hypothetical protein